MFNRGGEKNFSPTGDLLKRFFDVSLDLLCIADTDGNFIKVNKAWERVLGYPVEELEESRFLDFVHPEDFDATLEAISKLAGQEDVLNFVNRYRHRDGTYRFIEWRSNPSGKLIFAAARDITERILKEEELRKSEEKYRLLAENTEAILWEYDVLTDSWTYVAPQAERILGYSPEEWADVQFWADHIHEDDRSWATKYCTECMERGEAHTFEYRFLAKGGRIVWLRDVVSVEMQNMRPVRLRGFMVDITDRKIAEERISSLLQEKELILKEVHHRIKNNLSTIKGILTLQAEVTENPETKAALQDAAHRMQGMAALYDKLYRSENVREASLADYLPRLIEEILDLFPYGSTINTRIKMDDIVLNADILAPLGIIVNEIITNALKHAFSGGKDGELSVSAALMPQNRVRLVIEDNGPGFEKPGNSEDPEGFGLSLVELMVSQVGGSMVIEADEGTRFIIEFGK